MAAWEEAPLVSSATSGKAAWEAAPLVNAAVPSAPTPAREPKSFLTPEITPTKLVRGAYGLAEGATNMLTGMGASAVGGIEGINKLLSGGTVDQATERIRAIQDKYTYQPRTAEGETTARVAAMPIEYAGKLGKFMGKNSGIAELTGTELGAEMIGEKAPEAIATILMGRAGLNKAANRPNVTGTKNDPYLQAQAVRESVANSGTIEAGRLANQYGIAIDPRKVNPSVGNKVNEVMVKANDKAEALTKANAGVPENALKLDVGISAETPLSLESIQAARDAAGGSRAKIQQIGALTDDGTVSQTIAGLQPGKIAGDAASQKAVAVVIDDVITQINDGMTGADVLRNIEQLRAEARKTFNSTATTPEGMAQAKAKMGVSNALEGLIEQNLTRMSETDPSFGRLLNEYKRDRTTQAKTYALESIFDENTGKVRIDKLAKLTAEDNALTGPFSDLGKIAGVFPESFHSGGPLTALQRHLSRSGVPAAIGMGVGTVLAPGLGTLGGAIAGAGIGEMASILGARRIASPGYQKSNAVPVDSRPLRQALGYEKTPVGPEPLSLAPAGEPLVPPTPAGPMPQGRGLLGFADEGQMPARTGPQMPSVEMPVEPRLQPMFQRGGVDEGPRLPPAPPSEVAYPGGIAYDPNMLPQALIPPRTSPRAEAISNRSLTHDMVDSLVIPDANPLLGPQSELAIKASSEGMYPSGIGSRVETTPYRPEPLPKLPPQERGILSLEEMTADAVRSRTAPEQGSDFMGKTEFWQQPAMKQATEAFIKRAEELKSIISNKYPIDGRKQAAALLELQALEKEFGAGAKLGGLRGVQDAYSANYQAGGETQLPIQKTFDPRITAAILGRK
jgi:hypothetical protein